MEGLVGEIRQFVPKLDALLLRDQGDAVRAEAVRRDVDRAHEKLRSHAQEHEEINARLERRHADVIARIERSERRFNRVYWMLIGGLAVVEVVWRALPSGWLERFF